MSDEALFPQELLDALKANTLTDEETNHLAEILSDAGILEFGHEEVVDAEEQIEPPPAFGITGTKQVVSREIFRKTIGFDTRIQWQGINSKVQKRNKYKVITLSVNANAAEVPKWAQLFACIAASSALSVALASAVVTGGVTVGLVVAAILASAVVCFDKISPETFKKEASVKISTVKGGWH